MAVSGRHIQTRKHWLTSKLKGAAGLIAPLILVCPLPTLATAQEIALNASERAYLADNEPIVFVSQSNYPPFEFMDNQGQSDGMMVELAQWIADEAGFNAQFTHTDFRMLPSAPIKWREYWPHTLIVIISALWVVAWNLRLRQLVRRKTDELTRNQRRLTEILQVTGTATWELEVASGQLRVNDCWFSMLGYIPEQPACFSQAQWQQWVHPDDLHEVIQALNEHFEGKRTCYSCEFRLRHRKGHWLWVLDRGRVTRRGEGGEALTASGTRIDITSEKHAEANLRLAASVFRNAHDAIMLTDDQGTILDVNAAFTRITGYEAAEVINQPSALLDQVFDTQRDNILQATLANDGVWQGEVWEQRKHGEHYPIQLTLSLVKDTATRSKHFVIVFTDISHQKEYENRLQHLAYFDRLTDLPNREGFTQHLTHIMQEARKSQGSVMLAYLDLDGFKEINERYGHGLGDQVLRVVAERLRSTLNNDDIVARLGGDEFVMVLPFQSCDLEMPRVIQQLIQRVNQPIRFSHCELQVSASVGIAAYDGNEDIESDQFIRQADHAMYQAKQLGKNRYHLFDQAHERAVRGHHQSIARMKQALTDNEFVLFYQPKLNMRNGKVIGVEALIRWQHPEQGLLPPAMFMPEIQQHPFAIELGEWVVSSALQQCSDWKSSGIHWPVSVNIDGIHLQDPHFTQWLSDILDAFPDYVPGDLEIEVLESSALDDIQGVADIMRQCQTLGVRFALDDFGTGYSTLAYLRYLPAGMLKIDRSFVLNMLDNEEDLVMLKGVLSLAEAFQRCVIAEGVETSAQAQALLAIGCEYGQGYAFACPMPASQLLEWEAHFSLSAVP